MPNCPKMLSSLLPFAPAGSTPEQGFKEGLNDSKDCLGLPLRVVTRSPDPMNEAMLTTYQSCSPCSLV